MLPGEIPQRLQGRLMGSAQRIAVSNENYFLLIWIADKR
jgi:hypothetical protein